MDLTAFTIWGYALSWLEIAGFVTGFVAIYLAGRNHVATFFVGLLNCVLYFVLFMQQRLYSMMLLQVLFFAIDIYGIVAWGIPHKNKPDKQLRIATLQPQNQVGLGLGIIFGGLIWGWLVESITTHCGLVPSNYVYTEAIIFMANVAGQLLLARKKIENWVVWVAADIAGVALCAFTHMYLSALLYAAYTTIAVYAWRNWYKEMAADKLSDKTSNKKKKK